MKNFPYCKHGRYDIIGVEKTPLNLVSQLNQLEKDYPNQFKIVGTFADNYEGTNRFWALIEKENKNEK